LGIERRFIERLSVDLDRIDATYRGSRAIGSIWRFSERRAALSQPTFGSAWSWLRSHGTQLYRLAVLAGTLGLVSSTIGCFQARAQLDLERQRFAHEVGRDAAQFKFTYLILPPPDLLVPGAPRLSDRFPIIAEQYGDVKVLQVGDHIDTAPIDFGAVKSRRNECVTAECMYNIDQSAVFHEFVFLLIENVGRAEAMELSLVFRSTEAFPSELGLFAPMFNERDRENPEPFREAVGDLSPGDGVLVPLASLAVVKNSYPRGFFAIGPTREPISLDYLAMGTSDSTPVRAPADSIGLMPATGSETGG
jgi:hypothetical protein